MRFGINTFLWTSAFTAADLGLAAAVAACALLLHYEVLRLTLVLAPRPGWPVRVTLDNRYVFVSDSLSGVVVAAEVADLRRQRLLVEKGPMGFAFSADSRTAWVANHDAGSVTVVDVASLRALRDFRTGEGPETMELVGP